MIVSIHRNKIPKQYAFALKTSQLEDIMAGIDIPVHLYYYSGSGSGAIFNVNYRFPNSYYDCVCLNIGAGVLPKEDVFQARKELSEVALPEFIAWVKNILSLPIDSTYFNKTPYFCVTYHDKSLAITKH